jgi:hypothetical protein
VSRLLGLHINALHRRWQVICKAIGLKIKEFALEIIEQNVAIKMDLSLTVWN